MSPAACDLEPWRRAVDDNRAARRVVVVDAWSHVGIGHSIRASSLWLRLLSAANMTRSLRFASCVPSRLRSSFADAGHEAPACDAQVYDESTRRNVSAAAYDVHRDLTFGGLPSLSAGDDDFGALAAGWRPRPVSDCAALHRRLQRPRPHVLILYGLSLRDMIGRCVSELRTRQSPHGCLRHVQLTPPPPGLPPAPPPPTCDVGLHLRSMKLDDRHCELLTGEGHKSGGASGGVGGESCMFEWRQRRCKGESFPQVIGGCPGRFRYATADTPSLYSRTRASGWTDLNEEASITWSATCAARDPPSQVSSVQASNSSRSTHVSDQMRAPTYRTRPHSATCAPPPPPLWRSRAAVTRSSHRSSRTSARPLRWQRGCPSSAAAPKRCTRWHWVGLAGNAR